MVGRLAADRDALRQRISQNDGKLGEANKVAAAWEAKVSQQRWFGSHVARREGRQNGRDSCRSAGQSETYHLLVLAAQRSAAACRPGFTASARKALFPGTTLQTCALQVSELSGATKDRAALLERIFSAPDWAGREPLLSLARAQADLREQAAKVQARVVSAFGGEAGHSAHG